MRDVQFKQVQVFLIIFRKGVSMLKSYMKEIECCLIIFLFLTSLLYGNDKIKDANSDSPALFIIDYNVNLYKDKDSTNVQKKITFFDSIIVLSEDLSPKGRINVKLQDGTIGWVEEKYTSFIPKTWTKLPMLENYYCLTFSDKKINIKKDEDENGKMYYFLNSDIDIAIGINFLSTYEQGLNFRKFIIKREIQGGRAKKFNWNRELKIGNYQVNYIITTDHPDGGICESFDFAKFDELDQNKYYFISIDYQPYESKDKKLLWRKILFSTLQSLK